MALWILETYFYGAVIGEENEMKGVGMGMGKETAVWKWLARWRLRRVSCGSPAVSCGFQTYRKHIPVAPSDVWKVMPVVDKLQVVLSTMLEVEVIFVDGQSSQWTVTSAQQISKLGANVRRNVAMTKHRRSVQRMIVIELDRHHEWVVGHVNIQ